jgi:gluconate kinase
MRKQGGPTAEDRKTWLHRLRNQKADAKAKGDLETVATLEAKRERVDEELQRAYEQQLA